MNRVAIYYRVSTDKQDFDMQRSAIEEWLSKQPSPDSITIYQDVTSGSKTRRPGLNRLLADCNLGKVDTILVYKLDRFSRSSNHAIETIIRLRDLGVGFVSITQQHLDLRPSNPFANTILAMFSDLAQIEREQIAERVKQGLKAAKERGVKLGHKSKLHNYLDDIKEMRLRKMSYKSIAKIYKLSPMAVYNFCTKGGIQ